MIVGGAQENTLYNCLDLINDFGDDVELVTGPADGPEGRLLEQGRAAGLKIRTIDSLRRAIHPRDYNAYRQLRTAIADFAPDVVHTHSAKGGLLGRAAAWAQNVPAVIHSVHGAPFHNYQSVIAREFFRRCERWAANRCHRFICVADAMTDLMVDAGVADRSRFSTIYSGMEVDTFLNSVQQRAQVRRELGIDQDAIVVGKIARLFHLKGHEYLIDAARQIKPTDRPIKFLLVGDGILRAELESRIARYQLTDQFIFAGLVPPESVPGYLSAMDLLVHTSLREGLARSLPQALLSGIPAISYDVDGAREVVKTDETGILVPPKSIDELAMAIDRLVADPALRRRLGEQGRAICRERFDHHFMTSQIRDVYQQVLK
jgi:glycosyltransferase involved in cell wall biosynthesis